MLYWCGIRRIDPRNAPKVTRFLMRHRGFAYACAADTTQGSVKPEVTFTNQEEHIMRTVDEITALWDERKAEMLGKPYSQSRQAPTVYAPGINSALHDAVADSAKLPALIAHLHGLTALVEALAACEPEDEPETGDAGQPRKMGSVLR